MAIKKKGLIPVSNGYPDLSEFNESLDLPDGEYGFFIFDKQTNKALPKLKYFTGVVLATISQALPGNPPISALYRYFESKFSSARICEINGQTFSYVDLKNSKSIELDKVIEKTIQHAKTNWNIDVIERLELKKSENTVPYLEAYAAFWQDYSRTI